MFDLLWAETIDKTKPTLLIVSGVFQYFHEEKVITFINALRDIFVKAELIFDAANETGIKYANKYVQRTGNMNALMRFFVNDGASFAEKTKTVLVEERVFFTDARTMLAKKLSVYTRVAMRVVDNKKRAILLHLRLN